jgi:hypothetical protein
MTDARTRRFGALAFAPLRAEMARDAFYARCGHYDCDQLFGRRRGALLQSV